MTTVIPAEGALLDRVLATTALHDKADLVAHAYGRCDAALMKTAWGPAHRQRFALVHDAELLAGATRYLVAGVLDGRPVQVCAIGDVFTDPAYGSRDDARTLIERLLDDAGQEGAGLALLFADMDPAWCDRNSVERIPTTDLEIRVAQSPNRGAPMTLVRGGEERDLTAIVAMGLVRAAPFRFHLDRGLDFVQYAITRKRLRAGLGTPGARQLHFFIAEEGVTAAAYVVISVAGSTWTIEECGDRDPSGARVGAILQALIAREPVERRPSIRGWLPSGFVPPQITIALATPSSDVLLVRSLGSVTARPGLSGDDVLYWHGDVV
jgi:hypothetical protein